MVNFTKVRGPLIRPYPWLVSASARQEVEQHAGSKRPGLLNGWRRLQEHQEDWAVESFRGVAASVLVPSPNVRINPLVLRGLGVASVEEHRCRRRTACGLPGLEATVP